MIHIYSKEVKRYITDLIMKSKLFLSAVFLVMTSSQEMFEAKEISELKPLRSFRMWTLTLLCLLSSFTSSSWVIHFCSQIRPADLNRAAEQRPNRRARRLFAWSESIVQHIRRRHSETFFGCRTETTEQKKNLSVFEKLELFRGNPFFSFCYTFNSIYRTRYHHRVYLLWRSLFLYKTLSAPKQKSAVVPQRIWPKGFEIKDVIFLYLNKDDGPLGAGCRRRITTKDSFIHRFHVSTGIKCFCWNSILVWSFDEYQKYLHIFSSLI